MTASTDTTSTSGNLGATLAAYVIATYTGAQYVWGGLDCSGLVQAVYAHFGMSLPRVSSQQYSSGVAVDLSQLQPGDLVFYDPGGSGAPPGLPGHVAIYVGNGQVFQALNPSTPDGLAPVNQDWASPMGARRIIGVSGGGTGGTAAIGTGSTAQAATPSTPQTGQTVATGSGTTCAWALGNTNQKILIWNVNFSICILSKTEVRAILGGVLMGAGGIITLWGAALVMKYALDKSGVTEAVAKTVGMVGMVAK